MSSTARLGLIWAQTRTGIIGNENAIPWHVPEDMQHFRAVTRGHPVIMGRHTWDSLPPRFRPLPGRENIVLTRNASWSDSGASVVHSLDEALNRVHDTEAWVIGGGTLYAATIRHADILEVTELDLDVAGDTTAPTIDDRWIGVPGPWQVSTTGTRYRFVRYTRTDVDEHSHA